MWYEINVSRYGRHFFATHERSISTRHQLAEALHIFEEKFPESEGYKITVTRYETIGHIVE